MLVNFEDYNGNQVTINSDQVQFVSTFQHYDWDKELPEELMHVNAGGLDELNPHKHAEADALRTSERTIITVGGASFVVKGKLAEVRKALGAK